MIILDISKGKDSMKLGHLLDVETETSRDWAKDVDTETSSRLSLISDVNLKNEEEKT